MPIINLLNEDTINKIAAGEVVERPSSVVKELVENAIDAKATAITVEIKDGGTSFIRITDNGCGIDKEDIAMAFMRHSTSKIKEASDLNKVLSLGFRGEALSSIAAVSQIELLTKTPLGMTGYRYCIEGGIQKEFEEIGCPEGTTFIIRNLFYNTPARRKFLKSNMTEASYVSDLLEKLSLSHPDVSFKFINNGQNKLHTSGNTKVKDIIYNVYGRDITANLLEVSGKTEGIEVKGYIGKPLISRGNRAYENYFINGRYIKSTIITKAIEDAYKNYVMVHKFPFTVLHFNVDTTMVDVNVHPQKMEIRFNNGEVIYKLVYQKLLDVLSGKNLIPQIQIGQEKRYEQKKNPKQYPEPFEKNRLAKAAFIKESEPIPRSVPSKSDTAVVSKLKPAPAAPLTATPVPVATAPAASVSIHQPVAAASSTVVPPPATAPEPIQNRPHQEYDFKTGVIDKQFSRPFNIDTPKPLPKVSTVEIKDMEQGTLFDDTLLSKEARLKHKLVGQVFDTYWIVEYDGKIFFIDQHAAHEKVLYERLMASINLKDVDSQRLTPPMILTLTMKEEEMVLRYMSDFKSAGFEIEAFGGREYAVYSVPANLYRLTEKEMLMDMIDCLMEEGNLSGSDIIKDKIATMACKAAVKGNQKMSVREADALIEELLRAENPYNCPHGRPTIISMTKYELEKKFKRIV